MEKVIMAAGGVVENEKGELLLIFRKQHWDLPKGKLDEGESIEECAVREVQEETGLRNILLGELIDTTLHQYEENGELVTKKTVWYKMKGYSTDKLTPQTEEQIDDIKWVNTKDLSLYMQNSYPNIIHILDKTTGKS
jgi:ADP-ribose pyrophosphatase YjhB (NUDIX family)